jgi:hypothetical protein
MQKKMVDGKGGNLKTIHHSKPKGVFDDQTAFQIIFNIETLTPRQPHSERKKWMLLFRSLFPSVVSGRSSASAAGMVFPAPSSSRVRKKSYSWIRPGTLSPSLPLPRESFLSASPSMKQSLHDSVAEELQQTIPVLDAGKPQECSPLRTIKSKSNANMTTFSTRLRLLRDQILSNGMIFKG